MKPLAVVVLLAVCFPALVAAQNSSVHITTSVPGALFKVDGQQYQTAATLIWPAGSKHTLEVPVDTTGFQNHENQSQRFQFSGWSESTGRLFPAGSLSLTVTADPAVTSYRANFSVTYRVNVIFFGATLLPGDGGAAAVNCAAPGNIPPTEFRAGVVIVGGVCFWNSTVMWLPLGPAVINAFPYPGWVFEGWIVNGVGPSAYLSAFNVNGPLTLVARFSMAKRMRFLTEPPGLQLLVDRTTTPTPAVQPCPSSLNLPPAAPQTLTPLCIGEYDWAVPSTHVIGAPVGQTDQFGKVWVFDSFSNGSKNHSAYTVNSLTPETITARFIPGVRTGFLTQPHGLKLTIDGRDNFPSYNFEWGVGTTHTVSAAAEQVDARGRRYRFRGWSNGGTATQNITVPSSDYRLIATYDLLSQVSIQSSPAGATIQVDGADCATPCLVDRADGGIVRVTAPSLTPLSEAHRLEFAAWSDSGAQTHDVTVSGTETRILTANFRTTFRLQLAADPAAGARFTVDPPAADGYYLSGAGISVTAEAQPGFRFRRWEGDLTGTSRISFLVVNTPKLARALLDRVPFIAPAGIRNAAGETPDAVVKAGSLITIYGENLAPSLEVGPDNPLSQTLAGVTVTAGGRLLPLLFVSPQQINAQLSSDLGEGTHPLVVRWGGQQITGTFEVAKNAPGLFSRTVDSRQFVLALHEDGTPVTLESPARRGEAITFLGSGLGHCAPHPPDGFPIPAAPAYVMVDKVEILAGESQPETLSAAGAPGYVGIIAVKFRIGDDMPGASSIPLRVRVNGRLSNEVLLPVE